MSISACFSERELEKLWMAPEALQNRLLHPALAKLYEDPNVSEAYLMDWMFALRESVQLTLGQNVSSKARVIPQGGHEHFVRSCTEAGLANAMLKVAELTTLASKRARIYALSIWCGVTTLASVSPEQAARFSDNRVNIKISLLKALKSDMFMQRAQAVLCLRQFTWGPWARNLSHEDVAEIMVECLLYASADHQSVLEELKTRDRGWQRELMREMESISDVLNTDEAQAYSPRFYSQSRDEALKAVAGLLYSRETRTIRSACRDIIYIEPQILDQLLTIVCTDRNPWHPEATAYASAAQTLSYLLQTPHCTIPALWDEMVSFQITDFPPQTRGESDVSYVTDEWIAQLETWENFVEECPRWRQLLLEKWRKLQNETRADILRKFRQTSKYMAVETPHFAELVSAISERGVCRSCILRIFINLTNAQPDDDLVSTPELLSLLPAAYEASQQVPSETRAARSKRHANGAWGHDAWLRLERTRDVFVVPSVIFYGRKCLACDLIFSEYVLGPILLFSILRRINESRGKNFGTDVAAWVSLPPGTPEGTHLAQIQQIASPEVLDILLRNVVLKRIPFQKDEGTKRLRQKYGEEDEKIEADFARSSYLAAAELAIAVDQFHSSAGPYNKVREDLVGLVKKERVACLGNISEMSFRVGEWCHQYWYARHAISTVEDPEFDVVAAKRDGWDPEEMRAKNERRLMAAKRNIIARYPH